MRAILVLGFFLVPFLGSPSQAQVTIDASKITCDQFVHGKIGVTKTLAAWLSGFYHGQKNNPIIDKETFEKNLNNLEKFCYVEDNFKLPVMQVIEKAMGPAK